MTFQNFQVPSGEFKKPRVAKSESQDEVAGTSKPVVDKVKGRKFKESWKKTFPWVMKDPGDGNVILNHVLNKNR
jgi:hypothetical protein